MNEKELRAVSVALIRGLGAALIEHADLVAEYTVAAYKHAAGDTTPAAPEAPALPRMAEGIPLELTLHYASSQLPQQVQGHVRQVLAQDDDRCVFDFVPGPLGGARSAIRVTWDRGRVAIAGTDPKNLLKEYPYKGEISVKVDPASSTR